VIAALRRVPPFEAGLLAIATLLLVAVSVLERQTAAPPAFDSYSTFDAAGGGYRAYYEMLEREGVRVDRFEQRPAFLTGDVGTLVYAEPLPFDPTQGGVSKSDVAALETWVRGGGRLLYLGHDDAAARAGVLHLPQTRAGRPGAVPVAPAGIRSLELSGNLRWQTGNGTRVLFGDRRGAAAVTYAFGRGAVTAVVDETLFENARIARADHARFGYLLATQGPPGSLVAFDEAIHGYVVPVHWWAIVPRPFLIALVIAAAVLLVAFAGAAVRFGPPVLPPERADRTSADFIDALSSLLARGGAIRASLAAASSSATRCVARALGLPDGASNQEIAARIERDDVRAEFREMVAVADNGFADRHNLVRGVALAQRIRKEYAVHGRPRH
jgi:hypothetical protein